MKILLLTTVLWSAFAGGDRERGMQLYKDGKFVAAQAAFVAALEHEPESAELQWNLALAAWRAGDLETAEVAAEKYAALAKDAKDELHRGMLGAIRFAESEGFETKADQALAAAQRPAAMGPPEPDDQSVDEPEQPLPLLEKALQKAVQAKNHFVRGVRAKPTPEIVRNTERALRKIDELKKRIEELMKQQEEQDGDKNQDDKKPDDKGEEKDKNKSDDQKGDEQKSDEQKKDEQKGDDKKPDEKPSEGEQSDEKPDENKQDKSEKSDESDPKEGEGENPPESAEPKPKEGDPEPKPSPKEGKDGTSDPTKGEKPEDPEPGEEQDQTPAGEPPKPPEPKPGEQRSDAPGEGGEGLELTLEQAQRLMARAKKLDEQLKKAKARRTTRRRAVERDW